MWCIIPQMALRAAKSASVTTLCFPCLSNECRPTLHCPRSVQNMTWCMRLAYSLLSPFSHVVKLWLMPSGGNWWQLSIRSILRDGPLWCDRFLLHSCNSSCLFLGIPHGPTFGFKGLSLYTFPTHGDVCSHYIMDKTHQYQWPSG